MPALAAAFSERESGLAETTALSVSGRLLRLHAPRPADPPGEEPRTTKKGWVPPDDSICSDGQP